MGECLWKQLAQLQLAKDKWSQGELVVSHEHIAFTGEQKVQIAMSAITGMQKAKGQPILRVVTKSAARVFKLQSNDARESFLSIVNPLWKPLADARDGGGAPSAHVPPQDMQAAIFNAKPDIKALHARLVTPGHITEAEFWASKSSAIRSFLDPEGTQGQRPGLKSQLLTLLNGPKDPKTGLPKLWDDPFLEDQLFAEYPAVAAVYAASVPHVRTRVKFFQQFFALLQNRIERRRKKVSGTLTETDMLLTDFEEEVQNCEKELAAARKGALSSRLATADPTVNIAADSYDRFATGFGLYLNPSRENNVTSSAGASYPPLLL